MWQGFSAAYVRELMLESSDLRFEVFIPVYMEQFKQGKLVLVELFLGIDAHSCLHHSIVVARQQNQMSAFFIRAYHSVL